MSPPGLRRGDSPSIWTRASRRASTPGKTRAKRHRAGLFEALKMDDTPMVVDNFVNCIDELVRGGKFES